MVDAEKPKHVHRFAAVSGWCGCGYRDDGRLTHQGTVYQTGPEYTAAELADMLQKGLTHDHRNI